MPVKTKKVLQITLSEEGRSRLERLQKKMKMDSLEELTLEAFRFLEAIVDELDKGKTLVVMDPKKPGEYETIGLFEDEARVPPLQ